MKKAIYAGSFDPVTNGHMWVIEKASEMFDELIVAVAENPEKKYTFPLNERFDMIVQAIGINNKIAIVRMPNKFLANYAKEKGAEYIIRGVRNASDYAYEKSMKDFNEKLSPEVSTIFLMPPDNISGISSSFVKSLVGPEGWEDVVGDYVPDSVFKSIKRRLENGS